MGTTQVWSEKSPANQATFGDPNPTIPVESRCRYRPRPHSPICCRWVLAHSAKARWVWDAVTLPYSAASNLARGWASSRSLGTPRKRVSGGGQTPERGSAWQPGETGNILVRCVAKLVRRSREQPGRAQGCRRPREFVGSNPTAAQPICPLRVEGHSGRGSSF